MISLACSLLRGHKAGLAGVFVAVLFGSAVLTACGVLAGSGVRGGFPPERYAAAAVVAGAAQSLRVPGGEAQSFSERVPVPAGWAREIGRVPGVRAAVADVSVPVGLATGSGRLITSGNNQPVLAHGWSSAVLAPFTISAGTAPRGPGDAVLDANLARAAGIRPGDTVEILSGAVPSRYRVTGLAAPPPGGLARQSAVFLTDEAARRATGHAGEADTIGVIAAPGVSVGVLASRVRAAVPGAVTYTGDARAAAEFPDIGRGRSFLVQVAGSLGGIMTCVVLFVVAAALGVAIRQRGREMALLRAVAATPRQVRQLIGAEVLLVSAAAAAVGVLPGLAVAGLLRDVFISAGMIPAGFAFTVEPLAVAAAAAVSVLTAWAAALLAARRASRMSVTRAIAEASDTPARPGRIRLTAGYLLLAVGTGAAVSSPLLAAGQAEVIESTVSGAAILLLVAVSMLGPRWLPAITRLMLPRRRGPQSRLAAASLHARSRRVSLAAIPLIIAVALASVELFGTTTLVAASQRQARTALTADYVITSAGPGLSPAVTAAVARTPGVKAATSVARTQVLAVYRFAGDEEAEPFSAQGVTPAGVGSTMDLGVTEGSMSALTANHGGTVALSATAAGTIGTSVGQRIDLRLGDGFRLAPRVVAVYRDGLGYGDITLPDATVLAHTASHLNTAILVATVSGAGGAGALDSALARYPGVTVSGRSAFTAAQGAELADESKPSLVLNGILVAYVIIAMVSSLVMATAARAREFALLRLLGATGRQVRGLMRREAGVLAAAAVVIGTLVAVPPLAGLSLGLTGSPVPVVPPLDYLGIAAVVAVAGWGSIMIPARLALRSRGAAAR